MAKAMQKSSLPALRISAKRVNRRRRRMIPEIVVNETVMATT